MINKKTESEKSHKKKIKLEKIHETSIKILKEIGVNFFHPQAIEIARTSGAKIENNRVYFPQNIIVKYLEKAPSSFKLRAKNPENDLEIGTDKINLAPAYGAPFVQKMDEGRKKAKFNDYVNLTKLAANSNNVDILGGVIVEPSDISEDIRHLKMLHAAAINSDNCLMGSSQGRKKAKDCMKMCSLLFGEENIINDEHILITLINTNSPLQYDEKMLGSMIAHAKNNQPVIISSGAMSGTTAPATIAGVMALQNAEVLAGIILTQMITPGTPIVYGPVANIVDMKTANLVIGSPEYASLMNLGINMADFYDFPCRVSGALTDSIKLDVQAGYESLLILDTAIKNGADLILHSAGILDSYMTTSYEKFIIDDELVSIIKKRQESVKINDETIAYDVIKEVGPGGQFLEENHTFKFMKSLRESKISNRSGYHNSNEKSSAAKNANKQWKQILNNHEKPYIRPITKEKLDNFIKNN